MHRDGAQRRANSLAPPLARRRGSAPCPSRAGRRNVPGLVAAGLHVWTVDLLGQGRSWPAADPAPHGAGGAGLRLRARAVES